MTYRGCTMVWTEAVNVEQPGATLWIKNIGQGLDVSCPIKLV